ncbi:DNA polymerase [Psittacine adenovirus 1]|uniref:DNA polymerase n=1 Tax=Psittacine adenovirus 1 TaxID=318592 RepID=A0A2Z5E0I4_9ADEN|nr:DNA polymerase [Psittacine adenovirus 1]AXB73034.1 DNA polymerase [Psittacine adenovirus 1]
MTTPIYLSDSGGESGDPSESEENDSDHEILDPQGPSGPPLRDSVLREKSYKIRTVPLSLTANPPERTYSLKDHPLKHGFFYLEGVPHRFQPTIFEVGMRRFLKNHLFFFTHRSRSYNRIDYSYYSVQPLRSLRLFRPSFIGVLKFRGRHVKIKVTWRAKAPKLPPILLCAPCRNASYDGWVWVSNYTPAQHCPACGEHWTRAHRCSERRAAFYHHCVIKKGQKNWQHVHFTCPAQNVHNRQLIVTYDIETYTLFGTKGKRLQPFMLCFMLSGHPDLVAAAETVALFDPSIARHEEGFYWICTTPGVVAKKFRAFRSRLQAHFMRNLVDRYCEHNQAFFLKAMTAGPFPSVYSIPYELLDDAPLYLPEDFYSVDIVILGHNICKFDELLLATELLDDTDEIPRLGRCERSFMPRAGRLLFNDIFFALPNPNFVEKDPERLQRWTDGIYTTADSRTVFVRFMVRDTLQLTSGAKLSKAAAAYSLELSKGHCPYEAINEFISMGAYDMDEQGFPATRYWESEAVAEEQKTLWHQRHPGTRYDLLLACLDYCMLDVRVTKQLAHTLHESYDHYYRDRLGMKGHYNIFVRPTIPSNTHAFWKQLTFSNYVKRTQERRKQNKRMSTKPIPTDYVAEVYAPHSEMFKYIRQALRGGRCYPNVLGPYREPVFVFDICGMYASALTHPLPHGMPLDPFHTRTHVDALNSIFASEERPVSYFDTRIKPCIIKVEAFPPPPEMLDVLPPICSRRGGRLVWTNEPMHDEVITVIDAITLHNRGWHVKVLQDDMNVVFPEWDTLCSDYVSINIEAKEKADKEKNEVLRSISKMLSNALYGAFATNMDTTRIKFERDLSEKDRQEIYEGTQVIKHVTLLVDDSFPGSTVLPQSEHQLLGYSGEKETPSECLEEDALTGDDAEDRPLSDVDAELEYALHSPPFIASDDHAHYARARETQFKPLTVVDASPESLTILHLEKLDKLVENKRYATQIACFVLSWSRAFLSDWCDILHGPDRGTHIHNRQPQTLYGDTDSLFMTKSGYERMKTRGAHRIKNPQTRLTYDPENPGLYWACECDVKCKVCGADTYSSESIFLAPKLYGLKDAVCTNPECGHVGPGKLRSKGHRQSELVYDTLLRCWNKYESEQYGAHVSEPDMHTRRNVFKATLVNRVSKYDPFTIYNEQLTRVLRPWQDPTLYKHGDFLYPYDTANPNPRSAHHERLVAPPGDENDPLAPLRFEPCAFLSVDECNDLLSLLNEDGTEEGDEQPPFP